jgi:GR25 family glycosyltransferase involved in LPS biosynthesis
MSVPEICITLSHLSCISNWYYNTNDEYGFFCEDDVDFSISKFWNFSWVEFIHKLPGNWGCIQLCLIKNFKVEPIENYMKFDKYKWDNWSACAYIINRKYAEYIISHHYVSPNNFNLSLPFFPNTIPFSENIIYNIDNKETVYTFPLFVENINSTTTKTNPDSNKFLDETTILHHQSSKFIAMWWEMVGKFKTLNYFFES